MTEAKPAMSALRRRMIDDMTPRNLSPATQRSYLYAVTNFSRHFGGAPDRLGLEDVRSFQVHLVSQGISWPALNQTVCALRFSTASHWTAPRFQSASSTPARRASCLRSWGRTRSCAFWRLCPP